MKLAVTVLTLRLGTLFTGCTHQVALQVAGAPVPDHVVQARLPGSGIQVTTYYMRFFSVPEGSEALDTVEYLKFGPEPQKISMAGLQKLVLRAIIYNPWHQKYALWARQGHDDTVTEELINAGRLSRKEVEIQLQTQPGAPGHGGFTLVDEHGRLIYESPSLRYTLTK